MAADRSSGSGPTQVGLGLLSTATTLRRALDEQMARRGGSLAQSKLLKVLERHGGLTQARLAAELGLAPRSVTQTVVAMERDGLVCRTADDDDRRAKVVTMTPLGRRALSSCDIEGDALMQQVFGYLSTDQTAILDELLRLLDRALTERKD